MSHSPRYMTILLALLATIAANAQDQNVSKKLYRWVDKQGHVHYDDALPPEAVDQAHQIFNAKNGIITGAVDRALSPEERAQQAAAQKQAAELANQTNEKARAEEALLASYQTAEDLRHSYQERITLLKQTLASTDASLKSLRSTIITLLTEASENELNQQPIDAQKAVDLRALHLELIKQQALQSTRATELASLDAEFQAVLARFNALRTVPPSTTPPPAPLP